MLQRLVRTGACASLLFLTGCIATTPTTETRQAYAIFNITPAAGVGAGRIAEAIKAGLNESGMTSIRLDQGIPPSPLPAKPQRFQLLDPFGGSAMGAMVAASGRSMKIPQCSDTILTARANDSTMLGRGEFTSFFLCLQPYAGGFHLTFYTEYVQKSGMMNADIMGATIGRAILGQDSSVFIPKTIQTVVRKLDLTGSVVAPVEQYP